MRFVFILLLALLATSSAHAANVFSTDVQICSGRPWIDVTCPLGGAGTGADPTGAADSTTAINATFNTAITNGWPVFFPTGTYKTTSKITIDYQGIAGNGLEVISRGATIDGRTIASGNILQIQCSGGTTASPAVCKNLRLTGQLTVKGTTSAYVVVVGKTDFSDRHDDGMIDHLIVSNTSNNVAAGGVQLNYVTGGNLWLSGMTSGGSSSIGAVALEQVQTSSIGGYGSALGASAPALLIENGASVGNGIIGFEYDPFTNTCVSITSTSATRNVWIAPYFPCTTAINGPTSANRNDMIGATFAATNAGPLSTGVSMIGRGALSRYITPTESTHTATGVDDGAILSALNGTGGSVLIGGGLTAGASLAVTLPDPATVGSGWGMGFVNDGGKVIVLNPSAGKLLSYGKQLSTMTVGPGNFEFVFLKSDGANFRVEAASQPTLVMAGAAPPYVPSRWVTPGGPGYSATTADTSEVISSSAATGGLTVTLPAPSAIPSGWVVGLDVTTNGLAVALSGGSLFGPQGQTYATPYALPQGSHYFAWVQFDGTNFRLMPMGATSASCYNINDFGGRADNSTNNGPAVAQILQLNPNAPCIYFPAAANIYKFTTPVSYTMPTAASSLTIKGDGPALSRLSLPGPTNGSFINIIENGPSNAVDIRNLSLLTGSNNTDIGITISSTFAPGSTAAVNQPVSSISNVAFYGTDGFSQTDQWQLGAHLVNVGNFNVDGLNIYGANGGVGGWATTAAGTGVKVEATTPTVDPVVFNISNSSCYLVNSCIEFGSGVQGVAVSKLNATGCSSGIYVAPGRTGFSQMTISDGQFNCRYAINLLSVVPALNIHNNLLIVEGTLSSPIGINVATPAYAIITDNVLGQGTIGGGTGIQLGANFPGAVGGIVTGNVIVAKALGIALLAGAKQFTVAHNQMFANLQDIVGDVGTNVVDMQLDCTVSGFGIQFGGGTTGMTYVGRACGYVQVGKTVYVVFNLGFTSKGSSTGNATLGPLPVLSTSLNEFGVGTFASYSNMVSAPALGGFVGQGSTFMTFTTHGAAGSTVLTDANFTNNSTLVGMVIYQAP